MTRAMLKVLEGFHNQASQRIEGMTDRRMEDVEWECPLVADALEAYGIWHMKKYIHRR